MRASPLALALLPLALAAPAGAQPRQPTPVVIPRLTGPVTVDGVVDEPAWLAIPPLPVTQSSPTFGAEPSERTEIRLAHDGAYLYAAGRLYDRDRAGLRATSLRRDDGSFTNDWFVVNLDTFNDKENTLVFGTTPAGIRTDVVFTNDAAQGNPNFSWNTFWDAATRTTAEGWFAEIRIPLSSLRFQTHDGRVVMGVTAWRRIARKNEMITFPAVSPRWGTFSVFKASQAQEMALEDARAAVPLYVSPYVLGGAGRAHALNASRSGYDRLGQRPHEVGVDLKYALTSNLTLDVTYNTDFAQVEADDQQVNLTRFSLFFPEKRPFFQERASVFEFSTGERDQLFYSRRIGLAGGAPVPLYGGARVVGRLGAWDVGALGMQAERLGALPSQDFAVLRARRQVGNANSYVGGIVTSRLAGGDRRALYGVDAIVRLFGQDFVTAQWAQSFSTAAAEGAAGGAAGGPLGRGLGRVQWQRRGADGLAYTLGATRVGARFSPDLGFLERTDYLRLGDRVAYGWRAPKASPLLRATLALRAVGYRRNADGTFESANGGAEVTAEAKAGQTLTVTALHSYESLRAPFALSPRARVPAGDYRFTNVSATYAPSTARLLRAELRATAGRFYDGAQTSASVSPIWNASRHVELSGLYQVDRIRFDARGERFTAPVARVRARVNVDARWSLAGFTQYNGASDLLTSNVRLRWNPAEGTDLYVVYNDGLNTDPQGYTPARPAVESRTLLVKYARTMRLTL
jgi:hypothetical protein